MNNKYNKQLLQNNSTRSRGPSQTRPHSARTQHGSVMPVANGQGGHQPKVGARLGLERSDAEHHAAHEAWSDPNGLSRGRDHGLPLRKTPTGVGLPSVTKPGDMDRLPCRSELEAAIRELTQVEKAVQKLCNKFEQPKRPVDELPSSVKPPRSVLPLESLFQPQSFQPKSFQPPRNTHFVKGGNQGLSRANLRRASRALKVKSGTLHGNPHFICAETYIYNQ